jgi:hypothetical protein
LLLAITKHQKEDLRVIESLRKYLPRWFTTFLHQRITRRLAEPA